MSLKQKAAAGVKWTSISTIVSTILQYARLVVLARLLAPSDFGLMAMISIVLGFSEAFADMGISNAIIYRQDCTRNQLSSLYWINIIVGIIIYFIILTLSPLLVLFFKEPRLSGLLPWAAVLFLIVPFGQQFQVILQKELQFNKIAIIEIISAGIATFIAITSALLGQGVFSLIWGQLALSATKTLQLSHIGWVNYKPSLRLKREDTKGYINFGLYQMGDRVINQLTSSIDYMLIGRFLGSEILGIYRIAYELVITPLLRINPILARVAFPVFAKRQTDNAKLKSGYLEIIKLLVLVSFPLLVGLWVTAESLIKVVFSNKWVLSIPLISILVPVGMFKILSNPSGSIFMAKGRADIGFYWNLVYSGVVFIVFWFTVQHSIFMMAWSYVIISILSFILLGYIVLSVIDLKWIEYLQNILRPLFIIICMGVILYTSKGLLLKYNVNAYITLPILIIEGIIIYGLQIYFFERVFVYNIWKLIFKKKINPTE
jgi:O-antigen/teichoic acid export membrane protein